MNRAKAQRRISNLRSEAEQIKLINEIFDHFEDKVLALETKNRQMENARRAALNQINMELLRLQ